MFHKKYDYRGVPGLLRIQAQPQAAALLSSGYSRGTCENTVLGGEHTLERLNDLLRGHTHRTNAGEFLWRSFFDEAGVLRSMALHLLSRVWREGDPIYFVLDDTQTLKRAKKMQAVGKLYHHSEKRYVTGHTIFKAS